MLDSFSSLLNAEEDLEVIGTALNGKELIRALKTCKPDVVLLDISMPEMSGREALLVIKRDFPNISVAMLSMYYDAPMIKEFIELGACAYFKKNYDGDELISSIREVYSKGYSFSKQVSGILATAAAKFLTETELKVLKLLCQEFSSKKIGGELGISENTVETHRKNIFKKLGVKSALGAYKEAIKRGVTIL